MQQNDQKGKGRCGEGRNEKRLSAVFVAPAANHGRLQELQLLVIFITIVVVLIVMLGICNAFPQP